MTNWPHCWHWTGSKNKDGYGLYWDGRKQIGAHVFSFYLHYGNYPKGDISHGVHCERHCVNPLHLHVTSHAENIREIHRHRQKLIAEIFSLRSEVARLANNQQYLEHVIALYEKENTKFDNKIQLLLKFADELIKVAREQAEERNLLAAAWLQEKRTLPSAEFIETAAVSNVSSAVENAANGNSSCSVAAQL